MSGPSSTFSHPRRRRGLTLIEVVAALVLLGTILFSVTIARGRFMRQWADAERQLQATRAADALMTDWLGGPPSQVPRASQGPLAGVADAYWRTLTLPDPAARQLGAVIIRLELIDQRRRTDNRLLSVDFLLSDPPRRPATTTTAPAPAGGSP
jgi:prepilin-type N-terminal cleavage/methylation domain-containing protein